MNYREKRNAGIIEAITRELGPDFQPLPKSNRQFENLTTAKKTLGADQVAEVWILAVELGKGKPAAILDAIKTVENGVGTVEEGVEAVEETVETVEKTVEPSRLIKLKTALTVLQQLDTVNQFALESHDRETMEVYRALLVQLKDLSGMWKADLIVNWLGVVGKRIDELGGDDG